VITRRQFGIGVVAVAGDGLVKPVNAPAGQQTPVGVQPGTSNVDFVRFLIAFGPNGVAVGVFVYPPGTVPGPGNPPELSMSLGGKDPFGNIIPAGISSDIGGVSVSLFGGQINFSNGSLINGPSAGANLVLQAGSGGDVALLSPVTATSGTAASPTEITTDVWHTAVLVNGWTGTAQYKLQPDGTVMLRTLGSLGAGTLTNGTTLFTLPAGPPSYQPAEGQQIGCIISAVGAGSAASGASPFLTIGTNGAVVVENIAVQVATNIRFEGSFDLLS
jgi:hypothetical protein